jgi:hypothetical protein
MWLKANFGGDKCQVEGMKYIVFSLVYFGDYYYYFVLFWDVSGCHGEKGFKLYGKFDYYLIFPENLPGSCGDIIKILLSESQFNKP